MKKIIICALAALSVVSVLASCGSNRCANCYKKCSDKNSYNDGKYVICNKCEKTLTEFGGDVEAMLGIAEKAE